MEARDEVLGLRFWNGDPTARVLASDDPSNAILLERCEPGTPLRSCPEPEQDIVIASLLPRLWRKPPAEFAFRHLTEMTAYWGEDSLADIASFPDNGLLREGLRWMANLSRPAPTDVLLATDLHAGNVLRAQRQEWLVIDPKPFIGDRAYDATQHLLNCRRRLRTDPLGTVQRFAALLGVDSKRVCRWLFARLATEPDVSSTSLARLLEPR
jgi:streptomycin 6-kinase